MILLDHVSKIMWSTIMKDFREDLNAMKWFLRYQVVNCDKFEDDHWLPSPLVFLPAGVFPIYHGVGSTKDSQGSQILRTARGLFLHAVGWLWNKHFNSFFIQLREVRGVNKNSSCQLNQITAKQNLRVYCHNGIKL